MKYSITGILITGGWGQKDIIDIFNPQTGETCKMKTKLPDQKRLLVSFCGRLLCGGQTSSSDTCLVLENRKLNTASAYLLEGRYKHMCWENTAGILLLGGEYSPNTTELVARDGSSSSAGFNLQYDTV